LFIGKHEVSIELTRKELLAINGTPEPSLPYERLLNKELTKDINNVLSRLTEEQEFVIRNHFGLEQNNPRFLSEIGKDLEVCGERARQIESKALKKLRHPKNAHILKPHLERI
jgi:RNA polymerase primary sigma factor